MPQAAVANTFKCSQYMPQPSAPIATSIPGEFGVKRNKGKPCEPVLLGATRKVKTDNHTSLKIRFVLLLPVLRAQIVVFKMLAGVGRRIG